LDGVQALYHMGVRCNSGQATTALARRVAVLCRVLATTRAYLVWRVTCRSGGLLPVRVLTFTRHNVSPAAIMLLLGVVAAPSRQDAALLSHVLRHV
jgi:hypothetical protein